MDLIDLLRLAWRRRVLIVLAGAAGLIAGLAIAFLTPRVYEAELTMTPSDQEAQAGALASLTNQLGGFGSILGLKQSMGTDRKTLALATLQSRQFLENWVEEEKLRPVLFADKWDTKTGRWRVGDPEDVPTKQDAYRLLTKKILDVREDPQRGTVRISVEWHDPQVAADWANALVKRLNLEMRNQARRQSETSLRFLQGEIDKTSSVEIRKVLYRLMETQMQQAMLANVREDYAFDVIDPAVAPDIDKYARPKRMLVSVLGLGLGLVIGLLFAVIVELLRKEPAA